MLNNKQQLLKNETEHYSSCNAVDEVDILDVISSSRVCRGSNCDCTDCISVDHCCWRNASFCSVARSTPRSATRPHRRDISSAQVKHDRLIFHNLHCVQKKTPTHVFFYISVENV